mmetsp:Transcript_85817/g.179304  ORF Transcript_85817/g.179304 Transcript_85817/m.179304 type:complete len:822 (-) Transcript_85817:51-2516(-)
MICGREISASEMPTLQDCLWSLGLTEISKFLDLQAIARTATASSWTLNTLVDETQRYLPGFVSCRGTDFSKALAKADMSTSEAVVLKIASIADARGVLEHGLAALPPRLFVVFERLEPPSTARSANFRPRSSLEAGDLGRRFPALEAMPGVPALQLGGNLGTSGSGTSEVPGIPRSPRNSGLQRRVGGGRDGENSSDEDDEAGQRMPQLLEHLSKGGWSHLILCRSTKVPGGGSADPLCTLPPRFGRRPIRDEKWLHVQLPSCSLSRWPWTENLLEVSPMPGLKSLNLGLSIRDLCEVQDWQTFLPQGLEELYLYFGTWLPIGVSIAEGGLSELALPASLTRLDVVFDWRDMRGVGAKALPRVVPAGLKHLRLEARSAWFQSGGLSTLACLPKRLLSLDLSLRSCYGVGNLVSSLIAGMPEALQSLKLDVSYSDIQDRDVGRLATRLPSTLEILDLDVSNCSAMPIAAPVLAYQLPKDLKTLKLSFAYTQVAKTALAILLKSLPKSLERASFDLSGNYISGHRWPPQPSLRELDLCLNETVLEYSVLVLLTRLSALSRKGKSARPASRGVSVSMQRCHLDEEIVYDDVSLFATHLAQMRKEGIPLFPVAEDEDELTLEATTDPSTILGRTHPSSQNANTSENPKSDAFPSSSVSSSPSAKTSDATPSSSPSASGSSYLGTKDLISSPSWSQRSEEEQKEQNDQNEEEPLSSCSSCCSSVASSVPPSVLVWDFEEGRVKAVQALPPVHRHQPRHEAVAASDNDDKSSGSSGSRTNRLSDASASSSSTASSSYLVLPPLSRQFGRVLPTSGVVGGSSLRFAKV